MQKKVNHSCLSQTVLCSSPNCGCKLSDPTEPPWSRAISSPRRPPCTPRSPPWLRTPCSLCAQAGVWTCRGYPRQPNCESLNIYIVWMVDSITCQFHDKATDNSMVKQLERQQLGDVLSEKPTQLNLWTPKLPVFTWVEKSLTPSRVLWHFPSEPWSWSTAQSTRASCSESSFST